MQATTIQCSGICQRVKILSAAKESSLCVWEPVNGEMTLDSTTSDGTFDAKILTRSFCGLQIQAKITENNPMPNYCKDLRTCELSHWLLQVVRAEMDNLQVMHAMMQASRGTSLCNGNRIKIQE